MQYIARIITKQKLPNLFDFVDITKDINKVNNSIPTLIVGKELAEKTFGKSKIHVLNKQIDKNLYWTYTILERRDVNENDLEAFYNIIRNKIQNEITYLFFNFFLEEYERIKRFIKFLKNNNSKTICIDNDFVYIYYGKYVFGFSLEQIEFFNIKKQKVIEQIKNNKKNTIFDVDDINISSNTLKILENHRYLLPYLYYLKYNLNQNNIYYI